MAPSGGPGRMSDPQHLGTGEFLGTGGCQQHPPPGLTAARGTSWASSRNSQNCLQTRPHVAWGAALRAENPPPSQGKSYKLQLSV